MRFVIADDSRVTRLILQGSLQRAGHEVVGIAVDGKQAIELCREHRPEVIICDVSMPEIQGDIAAEQIIAEGLAAHVVMGTSMSQEGVVGRLKAMGCQIITKPFDGDTVVMRIMREIETK